jgi:hypothetical protein
MVVQKSKYKTLAEWCKENPSAYNSAKNKGLIPSICNKFGWDLPKLGVRSHPNGYWSVKDNVLNDALKYRSPTAWRKGNATAYMACKKQGWFDEATSHMILERNSNGYWTAERIFEESKKYKNTVDWKKGSVTSYSYSFKIDGLYAKCLEFMGVEQPKPNGYWTAERIFEESKKFKTAKEWKKGSVTSYSYSFKIDGLYEKCIIEMGHKRPKKIGYWQIKENVLAEAKKYKTRSEWGTGKNAHGASYTSAKKNGWFEEATAHMVEGCTPAGYWTKERLSESANKYKYFGDWLKHDRLAYQAAKRQGYFDECTKHMSYLTVPNGHWQIKENVLAEARKYKTRSEFNKKSSGACNSATQNGWYDECIAHMDYAEGHTPAGYWTKEKVLVEAKKYKTNREWSKKSDKSYGAATRNGWLDECREHMDDIVKMPGFWSIKENVLAEALKYKTRSEWQKKGSGSMKAAIKYGWFDECTQHMFLKSKLPGYWSKENVLAEALKYTNEKEWRKFGGASINVARKNGWHDECTQHMILNTKKNHWQIKENVLAEARKYKTRSEWSDKSCGSYGAAKKYGWFDECTKHMEYLVRPNGTWTKDLLLAEARKWDTIIDWRKFGEGIGRAKPLGCYEECIAHMTQKSKPMGFWHIKENVLAEALKYKSKVEWQEKSNGSMKAARQFGWLDECCAHMEPVVKVFYWNKERCIEEAKKYNKITEWRKGNKSSVKSAIRNGWYNECTAHMTQK